MEAEELIREIARTTGLRLDRSDPILAAAAINEAMLDQVLVKLDRQVKVQADRVTAASTQAVLDAKREAEALLTEAGEWIEAKIKAAGEAATERMVAEVRRELQALEKARRRTLSYAFVAVIGACLTFSGLAGFALANIR